MKIKDVFEKSVKFLKDKKFENPRLDAELLISHALQIERMQIYLKYDQPLSEAEIQNCREAIKRRGLGEPVAYITNEKGFFGETYVVGEGVLIPRPETELIVEGALNFIKENAISNPRILDLGAGTGCIGFSILKNCETATLVSIEKSSEAFKYLLINQSRLKLEKRSELIFGDVMATKFTDQRYDIIVANPPYISENDLQTEINVKKYEPHQALFAGDEGFSDLLAWSQKFKDQLGKPGMMLFEMGYQQGPRLKQHLEGFNLFLSVEIVKDLSGLDRLIRCTQ